MATPAAGIAYFFFFSLLHLLSNLSMRKSCFGSRRFVALNDNIAGFQAANDAVIEITGFSGNINNLAIA